MKRIFNKFFTMVISLLMIITIFPSSFVTTANAEIDPSSNVGAWLTIHRYNNGTETKTFDSPRDAWNYMYNNKNKLPNKSNGYITVKMNQDWIANSNRDLTTQAWGRIGVPENFDVTLDLNGFMIDRGCTYPDEGGEDYSIFRSEANSVLTIEDSNPTVAHIGVVENYIWIPKSRKSSSDPSKYVTLYGGVITGGNVTEEEIGSVNRMADGSRMIINGGNIVGNYGKSGGAFYLEHAVLVLNSGNISYNKAYSGDGYGGAVYVDTAGLFVMNNGSITHNYAVKDGGAVYSSTNTNVGYSDKYTNSYRGSTLITNGLIAYNEAENGGAIYHEGDTSNSSDTHIRGGVFLGNIARDSGGAFYTDGSEGEKYGLHIEGGTITGNTAKNGAGLYVNTEYAQLSAGTFINNYTSNKKSGAIEIDGTSNYLYFGNLTGKDIVVQNNTGGHNVVVKDNNDLYFSGNESVGGGSLIYLY